MMKMRYVTFGSLMVLVALLALALGANQVKASPFITTQSITLNSSAVGATSDIHTSYSFGITPNPLRSFPGSFSTFTPAGWNVPTNAGCSLASPASCAYPIGTATGTSNSTTSFGLFGNGACAVNIPIFFPGSPASTPLENASTDTSDVITSGAGFANLIADVNPADGVPDGAEHWNDLLAALGLPGARERQVATANLLGTTIWVDAVTYDPGVLAPAGLGYITLTIVENFSPALPASPSLITDACGLSVNSVQFGLAANGAVHRSNPTVAGALGGTYLFFTSSQSQRDADNDGFVNSLDTCPFTPNVGNPESPFNIPGPNGNGDFGETPGDGIDAACDANPTTFDGLDVDSDGFLNRGDNCPNTFNPSQTDILELGLSFAPYSAVDPAWWAGARVGPQPVDGGPKNDGIGDACDINPSVADGHFHNTLIFNAVCIPAITGDSDGDGWCDATEFGLGSNPGNPASTPENLAIPTTCSDGKDNDANGATDLADAGCQLPNHDIAFKTPGPLVGSANVCGLPSPSNVETYTMKMRSNSGNAEPAQIGILLKAVPGTNGSGPAVTSVSGATVTGSGPINIDGNTDVEWLTKGLVTVAASGLTTVDFTVTFPPCSGGTDVSPADYLVTADVCHGNDVAPLGLFGATDCGAAGDGGQDRVSTANDAPVTKLVNDQSK